MYVWVFSIGKWLEWGGWKRKFDNSLPWSLSRSCSLSEAAMCQLTPPSLELAPSFCFPCCRNHFQQWEDMEGDPALLPSDPAGFRDGEKEHGGPCSTGSVLPGGGVEKNQRWVILFSLKSDFNRLLSLQ